MGAVEALAGPVGKLVLMFPGQGSQAVGMGCDLAEAEPIMRAAYDEASEVLGYELMDLCATGPVDQLARTDRTQPALLANSIGILRVLEADGLRFAAALGHSLGDYSALVATGALGFQEALRIVRRRGEEMLDAARRNPGGMAAIIGLADDAVDEVCTGVEGVWPANYNSPGQVVVSGTPEGLAALRPACEAAGAKRFIPLAVSGAFHSPLVAAAVGPLRAELESASWETPDPAFFSTTTVSFETREFHELLQRQLVTPVRFTQSVRGLLAAGYDSFLEVGSGSVLTGLVKRIAPEAAVSRVSDVETLATLREARTYLEAR